MITFLIISFIFLCFIIYWFLIKPFKHWTNKGIPQLSILQIWWISIKILFQIKPIVEIMIDMYEAFPKTRYSGMYQVTTPLLFIRDPELIRQILIKDFDYFTDHNQLSTEERDPLWSKNLPSLKGERWKDMRATVSPSFTSSKMKGMFGLMSECAERFVEHFQNPNSETVIIELKDAFTRYTNDVIASISFGINCDSLKDPENEFLQMGRRVTNFYGFWRNLFFIIMLTLPSLRNFLGLRMLNDRVSAFFKNLVVNNIADREKNGIIRPDMIHLLMEAKKGRLKHDDHLNNVIDTGFALVKESAIGKDETRQKTKLTIDDITAQALIFFFAGFESVSTLMCFVSYELAAQPTIQGTLQEEIDTILSQCNGKLTYEMLLKMEYLDMVITESLRKWPSGLATDRVCVKPYIIEPKNEGEHPVYLKEGDTVWFPIYAIQRDNNFFPDSDRFDPERFSIKNRANIVPYTYLPFGIGPRGCIGNRFALLEAKILLFHIIKYFEIVVVDKSVLPLKLCRKQFTLNAENGFWFGFKPRNRNNAMF